MKIILLIFLVNLNQLKHLSIFEQEMQIMKSLQSQGHEIYVDGKPLNSLESRVDQFSENLNSFLENFQIVDFFKLGGQALSLYFLKDSISSSQLLSNKITCYKDNLLLVFMQIQQIFGLVKSFELQKIPLVYNRVKDRISEIKKC